MTDFYFLNGIIFGLILAAPVGPVAALCFERTITEGRMHGLLSGLGAALADAVYGAIAAFGISAISMWVTGHQTALRLVGGIIMLLLAVKTVTAKPRAQTGKVAERVHTESLPQDFLSAFFLAITNPITLITFAGLFAALGVKGALSLGDGIWLVIGVFIGSALWWFALSAGAGMVRGFIDVVYQRWINRISAAILLFFGVFILGSIVMG